MWASMIQSKAKQSFLTTQNFNSNNFSLLEWHALLSNVVIENFHSWGFP